MKVSHEDRLAAFLRALANRNIRMTREEAVRWFNVLEADRTDPEALDDAIDKLVAGRPPRK